MRREFFFLARVELPVIHHAPPTRHPEREQNSLLRVGAALLMDDLRVLCSARLAEVVDADNADALEAEAEAAFAPRLSAACRRAKRAAS